MENLPFYQSHGSEIELFERAWRNNLPLLIKGPTGCGKTRFVAHMAAKLCLPLHTVACHCLLYTSTHKFNLKLTH